MLESAGIKSMLNELSSTVVFERPTEETFIRKWQLACEGGRSLTLNPETLNSPRRRSSASDSWHAKVAGERPHGLRAF